MLIPFSALLLASITYASPIIEVRTVDALKQPDTNDAHPRDDTATRAFASTEIITSDGKCLFVDPLSGDFRANLNPIQVADCNGSTSQLWDIITKGVHNDQAGQMLIVNTGTQACLNFDPRRAAGNQVIMFSCGGRADGGGGVTNSQLFPFAGGAGPLAISPSNSAGTCLTVTAGNVLDQATCNTGDAKQSFTFGGAGAAASLAPGTTASAAGTTTDAPVVSATPTPVAQETVSATSTPQVLASTPPPACESTTVVTVTRFTDATSSAPAETLITDPVSSADAVVTQPPADDPATANPTTRVPVSGAGGFLQPSSAAEANQRNATDTRALSAVSIKSSTGNCLFIDPTAGDFRQNLIPIAIQACTGAPNEKFDFITSGEHNNAAGATLIVSSLTNGCVSFDPRRDVNKAHVFSCGGRADGNGETSNSQLFPFTAGTRSLQLAPENGDGKVCLVDVSGKLDQGNCTGDASQTFTIV